MNIDYILGKVEFRILNLYNIIAVRLHFRYFHETYYLNSIKKMVKIFKRV